MPKKSPAVPKHIAIIPDGNRRWAKKRGLKPWEGHLKGIGDFAQDIAWTAFDAGVEHLTIWGGSYDNLTKRSKIEIRMLNEAYRRFVRATLEDEKIYKRGVRVIFLGEWRKVLEAETIELINKIQSSTKNHKNYHLTVLVAYNGDKEMLYALNAILKDKPKSITPKIVKSHLWTAALPPVDLVIRTGDKPHLSAGFMMWDVQYAELYFSKKMWPDFTKKDLLTAIKEYSSRERRFGN